MELRVRNVNEAYHKGMKLLHEHGEREESRAGPVIRYPEPVCTIYERPQERVIFNVARDANPFFHLMEALWMLAGRNDVAWISDYNKSFAQFSDDKVTFNGAYGYRWRKWFGRDQIRAVISMLLKNPNDRRVVLQMWDPKMDLGSNSVDVPCNISIKFDIRYGQLNMYVFNRSNDIIWGAYGANAVHMSILQEYVAAACAVPIGRYYQYSMDYHAYESVFTEKFTHPEHEHVFGVEAYPAHIQLAKSPADFDGDLALFIGGCVDKSAYDNPFFPEVAIPMSLAYRLWRRKLVEESLDMVAKIAADDWHIACSEWMSRRLS